MVDPAREGLRDISSAGKTTLIAGHVKFASRFIQQGMSAVISLPRSGFYGPLEEWFGTSRQKEIAASSNRLNALRTVCSWARLRQTPPLSSTKLPAVRTNGADASANRTRLASCNRLDSNPIAFTLRAMEDFDPQSTLAEPFGHFSQTLAAWAQHQPEKVALRDDAGSLLWADMHEQVERIAARLADTGLERGQAVAILGTSSIAYALVFLAAIRAGGVAAPLTTSASAEQLQAMARDSGARHLFVTRAKLDEIGADTFAPLDIVVLDEALGDWMAPAGSRTPEKFPEQGDPFNIIYSSGTTGTPKGIVHSHRMRWRQFASTAGSWLEAGLDVRTLASTPLYSNTTMVAFLPALLAGGTVRIMGKFGTIDWLTHAQADRTAITMLVPVQYQRLMDEPRFDEFDLSALKLKYCTSAPFSAELKREVLSRMPGALIEIYSMTEGGVVCLLEAHKFPDKLHTVGRPAPGSELKVLDDEDREVAPGIPGNLVGRSHTMMSGYKDRPDQTKEGYWQDPETGETWQRMGDIGRVDEEGFVELVGRAKDMIISGGFNIYPVDLENELLKETDVGEAAVIGVESRKWGETPVGFVTLTSGERSVEAIRNTVNARLGKTQRLSQLHSIDEMPRSHIGKLLKTELRELATRQGLPD